jgi:hypothetical protein
LDPARKNNKFGVKDINLKQQLKKLFATNEIAITKEGTIVYFPSITITCL